MDICLRRYWPSSTAEYDLLGLGRLPAMDRWILQTKILSPTADKAYLNCLNRNAKRCHVRQSGGIYSPIAVR